MKARIPDDLMDKIDSFFGGTEGHKKDPLFIELCDKFAGTEVELKFINDDAFIKDDPHGYWIPSCCYELI